MKSSFSKLAACIFLVALLSVTATDARGQCTPPAFQGWVNSCSGLSIRFLNRNPVSQISRYEVVWLADGVKQTLAGSALSASRQTGCNFASHVRITQYLHSGLSCSTTSGGSAPHSFPCDLCEEQPPPPPPSQPTTTITVVRAADSGQFLAPNSIATIYGQQFTSGYQAASSLPLPTTLAGVGVRVNGIRAGLFFVNDQQINFLLPAEISTGPATIEVLATDGQPRNTTVNLFANRPAVFTENQRGSGYAAADYYRFDSDPESIYASLWATGINDFDRLNTRLRCGTERDYTPIWLGPSTSYAGLVQINLRLPIAWSGSRVAGCRIYTNGTQSNAFDLRP
jgi:hypothetical protein